MDVHAHLVKTEVIGLLGGRLEVLHTGDATGEHAYRENLDSNSTEYTRQVSEVEEEMGETKTSETVSGESKEYETTESDIKLKQETKEKSLVTTSSMTGENGVWKGSEGGREPLSFTISSTSTQPSTPPSTAPLTSSSFACVSSPHSSASLVLSSLSELHSNSSNLKEKDNSEMTSLGPYWSQSALNDHAHIGDNDIDDAGDADDDGNADEDDEPVAATVHENVVEEDNTPEQETEPSTVDPNTNIDKSKLVKAEPEQHMKDKQDGEHVTNEHTTSMNSLRADTNYKQSAHNAHLPFTHDGSETSAPREIHEVTPVPKDDPDACVLPDTHTHTHSDTHIHTGIYPPTEEKSTTSNVSKRSSHLRYLLHVLVAIPCHSISTGIQVYTHIYNTLSITCVCMCQT